MSLNITSSVEQNLYSVYAARLDEIQDRQGIVIVNSAGNLDGAEWRAPWPRSPRQAITALAGRTSPDTIYMPCESVRALAVGAINPPNGAHLEGAPATYTRRGPGLRVGVKPDLAHPSLSKLKGRPMGQRDNLRIALSERLFHGCDEAVVDGASQVCEPRIRCIAQKHSRKQMDEG